MPNPVQDWLNTRLQPPYLRLIAGAVVLIGMTMAIVSWTTSNRGMSAVGIPWGADFAGFYVAAQILDHGDVSKLYDRDLHARLYHELLPNLPKDEIIPYVHPPFVAGALRLLTGFSYDTAAAIWLVISMVLYLRGVLLVLKTCPLLDGQHRWLVVLLAISFEPFLFETWLGGQLSAVAFFSFALCYFLLKTGKPLLAGVALGLCFYKPTLLVLMIPMLLAGRQWLMLAGMTLTGVLYLSLSMLFVGWGCTLGYVDVLLVFREQSSAAEIFTIRQWKYVDINHFWQMLTGHSIGKQAALGVISLAVMIPLIGLHWWRNRGLPTDKLWTATLFLIPVVNLYFGIYDTVLVVQAAIIVTELVLRQSNGKLLGTWWPYWLLLLAIVPWFSQPVAKSVGVQVLTLVLLVCAIYAFRATEWRNVNSPE